LKKVSIIIPVYNSEKDIEECILSVINQTLTDIEVILIDDGSTDNSPKIIKEYQEKYPQMIKIKTIQNSGAATARNIGLEMATGEYIGFVDSDDYIESSMFEKLYNQAKEKQSDITICGYFLETKAKSTIRQIGHLEQYDKSIKENPNIYKVSVPYLWNKIFKRDFIIKYQIRLNRKLRIFEDLEFVYKLYMEANKISKVDEALYHYRKQNEGALTEKFSEKFFDIIPALKSLKKYAKKKEYYQNIEEYLTCIALKHIYIRCNMEISENQLKMKLKYINKVFRFLDKEFPNWKENELYFKNKNKDEYISKEYWKQMAYMQAPKPENPYVKFYKKMRKKLKKTLKLK